MPDGLHIAGHVISPFRQIIIWPGLLDINVHILGITQRESPN